MDHSDKQKKRIDRRLVYILPSVLALALALTSCLFQFGNYLVDLKNVCYTIFVSVPEEMSEEMCVRRIENVLFDAEITGFTLLKNTKGGTITEDGLLVRDSSFQVSLMNVPRKSAEKTAVMLQEAFGDRDVMIEETIVKTTYMAGNQNGGDS